MVNQPVQMRLGPKTERKLRELAEHYRWTPGQAVAELVKFYERLSRYCDDYRCYMAGDRPVIEVQFPDGSSDVMPEEYALRDLFGLLSEIKRGPLSAFRPPMWPDPIPEHHKLGDFIIEEREVEE